MPYIYWGSIYHRGDPSTSVKYGPRGPFSTVSGNWTLDTYFIRSIFNMTPHLGDSYKSNGDTATSTPAAATPDTTFIIK